MDGLQLQWLLDPASVNMASDLEAYFRQLATEEAWQAAAAGHPVSVPPRGREPGVYWLKPEPAGTSATGTTGGNPEDEETR